MEIPRKPTPAEVLVLVTRARAAQIAAGTLDESRLFDLRVFKCVAAELAYYRRLAHAQTPSAHIATAMPQLVKGLARLHPRWTMSGDPFEDRDRHHTAVRRRLAVMVACGLLTWQAGVNDDGEEARTELLLIDPPSVTVEELAAARGQLALWRRRYGSGLNTGSSTGIRGVQQAAAEPSKAERRACARQRIRDARAASGVRGSGTKTAPPFGPSPASQGEASNAASRVDVPTATPSKDDLTISSHALAMSTACGLTRGARRAHASSFDSSPRAVEGSGNSSTDGERPVAVGDLGHAGGAVGPYAGLTVEERGMLALQRVADRQAEMQQLHHVIARQATGRAEELAASGPDRAWPAGRIKEAWVVARFGATAAAQAGGGAAFRLDPERHRQLERAVRRYNRHAAGAPDGWPTTGWAAFLFCAGDRAHAYPAGTIEALDQITKGMRARADAASVSHENLERARRRAEKRRQPDPTAPALPFSFRLAPPGAERWPAYFALDATDAPILLTELEQRRAGEGFVEIRQDRPAPPPSDAARRLAERDAFLLAGQPLPTELSGREERRLRDLGPLHYDDPRPNRPQARDLAALELARLEGLTLAQIERLHPQLRHDMLLAARGRERREQAAERQRFLERLTNQRPGGGEA